MRTIKFRAYDTDEGCYVQFALEDLLDELEDFSTIDLKSVQQYIGVDQNGREVYEGNTIKLLHGKTMTAQMRDVDFIKYTITEEKVNA